ncbi:MAG TPA: DNA topoisomerase IV subunit A [Candidatus Nanoarchaeia archaeon]|nr:DNA topoisomerase IV subunit A [Candidatus Nanoarchaeia archaeon]
MEKKNKSPLQKAKEALDELGKDLVKQINKIENPTINLPVRGLSNINYNKTKGTLELGDKMASRSFFNLGHAKKFMQTLEVAAVSKELLNVGKHASLRDVFYQVKRTIPHTNINMVDDQVETDSALEDLELITGCSREQLNVNANKNGSVAGKVVIEDRGDTIDWSKLGSGGWSIPSNVEEIEFKKVNAKYLLYMEKAAIFERLLEDRYWDKQNCIIMSSQGQTTRGIRRLLQRLSTEHDMPIYVLTDLDSWGHYIYSVVKYGSIALAHMSEQLTIPSVKYLGIRVSDVEEYGLQKNLIKLNEKDIARLNQISGYDWFKDHQGWQKEFKAFKQMKAKAEIQALSARGISFISDKYLPEKVKRQDFLD